MQKQTISQMTIYGDGSALGNPGPGGYGTVIEFPNESYKTEQVCLKGGEPHTTNNRMEMRAVIEGLAWVKKNHPTIKFCTVVSDSRLVIETLNSGWKRKKNLDLWKNLDALLPHFTKIKWEWVKGHNGHKQNTIADRLANGEAERMQKEIKKNPKLQVTIHKQEDSKGDCQESLF